VPALAHQQHHRRIPVVIKVLLTVLLARFALPGDLKKPQIDKNSPEGQFLDLVELENDAGKQTALLEQFLTLFPRVDSAVAVWIYGELQDRYRTAGLLDKAIVAGEKILAIEPDSVEVARANWRMAESKGDPELVKRWSAETEKIAERVVKAPLPSDSAARKAAEERAAYARQFITLANDEEYRRALQTKDPAQRVKLLEDLVKKSPQNPYMEQIEIAIFLGWKEIGNVDRSLAAAETVVARDGNRVDALLFVAEVNFQRKRNPQRTLGQATKVIERLAVAPKPDGMTDREWSIVKNQNLRLAYSIIGTIQFEAGQWAAVDQAFRGALQVAPDDQVRATLLFQLGWANYQMRNALEAIRLYVLCAAIPGPLQEQASKRIAEVKSAYNLP
jgi:tetratricopeptide (TPR) repeat protein